MNEALRTVWSLTPGSADPPAHTFTEPEAEYPSAFAVDTAAAVSVGAATLAAAELATLRSSEPAPGAEISSTIDVDHAQAAFTSHLRVEGESLPTWAELSGRYRTADDRFVQIHANFAHHASGVARRLGVAEERDAVEAAIATWNGADLEQALIDDGMICALYRTEAEWDAHPHAAATANLPLIEVTQIGDAPARQDALATDRALDSIRVLDCSRVLAGPVCGQTLAAHGADVLRIGAPHLPSVPVGVISTGFGKRNAYLDLDSFVDRIRFSELLSTADVFVDAYRPGALAARGFGAERAAALKPGIVVIEICAFDWVGPWAGRRGFDSIVQSTTGLAMTGAEQSGSNEPVHLPFQALDHATGFFAAHAATRLLTYAAEHGGSWRARLSLLRTRNWLAAQGEPQTFTPVTSPDLSPWTHTVDSSFGRIEAIAPAAGRWDRPPSPLGSSTAAWAPPPPPAD